MKGLIVVIWTTGANIEVFFSFGELEPTRCAIEEFEDEYILAEYVLGSKRAGMCHHFSSIYSEEQTLQAFIDSCQMYGSFVKLI